MGATPDSGLFVALMALLVAGITGANTPEDGNDGVILLDGEVSLLALASAPPAGEGDAPNFGSDKPALDAPNAYFKIPNFDFEHLSNLAEVPDRMACQRMCNENSKCRSYSFSEATEEEKEESKDSTAPEDEIEKAEKLKVASKNPPKPKAICKWSPQSLHYRIGWKFFTKAKDVDWKGRPHLTTENFHEFAGLEYQEPGWKVHPDIRVANCKVLCAKDPKCGAFSYHEDTMTCRLAGRGLNYNKQFAYYEKPMPPEEHENQKNENVEAQNAQMLKTQEKQAKTAGKDAFANDKIKREESQERFSKNHEIHRAQSEASHKHNLIKKAEKALVATEHKERDTKQQLQVQGAFEEGYFESRGMVQEKKTKEVALKSMILKHEDIMGESEKHEKSGEYKAKLAVQNRRKKVQGHEAKMAMIKERLMKVKNDQMKHGLRDQQATYQSLSKDESVNVKNIEAKHREKIRSLKRWTSNAKEAIVAEESKLRMELSTEGEANNERIAESKKVEAAHEAMINSLKVETAQKVKEIIDNAKPS